VSALSVECVAVRLVLASASPGRFAVLRAAGIDPVVRVSGVDEEALAAALTDAVGADIATEHPDAVIVGCDSMLHIGGELVGKPGGADAAARRWQAMAGSTGELLTGHAVVRLDQGVRTATACGAQSTLIRFGTPSAKEIEAYVETGEPLQVAGGFTLDGRGGWFVDGIDGDPSSVIGISLPLTRRLLAEVAVPVVSLWTLIGEPRLGSRGPIREF
jgi:septum formation protein